MSGLAKFSNEVARLKVNDLSTFVGRLNSNRVCIDLKEERNRAGRLFASSERLACKQIQDKDPDK